MSWQILQGDVRERLSDLEPQSIQTCVTSPPYWGLRDYGTAEWDGGDPDCDHAPAAASRATRADNGLTGGKATIDAGTVQRGDCRCGAKRIDSQLGLEPTPEEYVANLVAVFREVRRVLRDDGTVWLNLGDSYAGSWGNFGARNGQQRELREERLDRPGYEAHTSRPPTTDVPGLKPKDLCGIPWRVAFALQADGWWLRSDIIWNKPNPMPESVTDRPTRSHEYIFLLTKSARYVYDADAIREETLYPVEDERPLSGDYSNGSGRKDGSEHRSGGFPNGGGRNKRSVWTITTQPYAEAHFATFPPKLIEPCILAGAAEGDTVLDPFVGSGTTGVVALRHDRSFIGIELNPEYCELARNRIRNDAPLLNTPLEVAA